MSRVTTEDLQTAAQWLEEYEGEDDEGNKDQESESCERVARWLEEECLRRQRESVVQKKARDTGLPPARIRAALKALEKGAR